MGITASFPRRKESIGLGGIATFPRRKDNSCLGITASFTGRKESSGLGGTASFQGKVSSCQESIASFPSRKESSCLGETASFWGKVSSGLGATASFWGKVSSCRESIGSFPGRKESNCLGETAFFQGKVSSCLGETASFRVKVSSCQERIATFPWRKMSYGWRGVTVNACLPVSLGCVIDFPQGGVLACLVVWETKLLDQIVALALVIFPYFLLIKLLNLFNCLCLTLMNLVSLTLSMKPWHSVSLTAEIIEVNWVLQSSVCFLTWSKMLLMALTLAWSKSFSAFLIICLALDVFIVDLSLMLTGTKSLWRHLRVKILWLL